MNMPKPVSRPKCPSCYGEGKERHEFGGHWTTCFYCDGQGYDPYYTGEPESTNKETDDDNDSDLEV